MGNKLAMHLMNVPSHCPGDVDSTHKSRTHSCAKPCNTTVTLTPVLVVDVTVGEAGAEATLELCRLVQEILVDYLSGGGPRRSVEEARSRSMSL